MRWLAALQSGGALPATLVVVAHPDDETVDAGSVLPRLHQARFVYCTDGAPVDGQDARAHGLSVERYRDVRRAERAAALRLCGIGADQVIELGCVDQQAAHHLPILAVRLLQTLREHRPAAVLTHPYEGGHPDHDAAAFAVHAALQLMRRNADPAPELIEMASYHAGPQGLVSGKFLPDAQADRGLVTLQLDADAQARKRELLACYATQAQTLGLMRSDVERFRPAPRYDFLQPPAATAYYERFGWGTTAATFCELAASATRELGLEAPPWG